MALFGVGGWLFVLAFFCFFFFAIGAFALWDCALLYFAALVASS
jgi:hypothetical protein